MSNADPRRVFLRRLLPALVVAALLWVGLRPALDSAVCGLSQLLIHSFEIPHVTRIVAENRHAVLQRADLTGDSQLPALPLTEIHFNTIVLLTLFLALPRPFSRLQLERLFMAWTTLFALQTLNLVFHVEFLYATSLGPWSLHHYGAFARNVYGFLQYFFDLPIRLGAPFVLWVAFNWELLSAVPVEKPARGKTRKTG